MKVKHLLAKNVAEAALSVTKANVNSICFGIIHQPKLPKNAKKLKK